jgi:hypothetical protein
VGKKPASIIDLIRQRFDGNPGAEVKRCAEGKARIGMSDFSQKIILKGEKICRDRKVCDCLIFALKGYCLYVAAVELKSGTTHATEIQEKLTTCARMAQNALAGNEFRGLTIIFDPVLVSKTHHSSEFKKLSKIRILWGATEKRDIRFLKPGQDFSQIVKSL